MNLFVTLYDNRYEKLYDISSVIINLKIYSYIEENPGKCTFDIIRTDKIAFWEGATVAIQLDGVNMFRGFVFVKKRDQNVDIISVTCYDQLRYLKNKDSRVFENMTSDQIFTKLCSDFVLKCKVVDSSSYICAPRSNDATSLYEMIKNALDDTLINNSMWFFIRDNFGVLEHINISSCKRGVILGDSSGVMSFTYETSIDKDVYNQIKLYRDNTSTGKREVFIVNDTINDGSKLKAWGILQLYQKVDTNLNIAQIENRAKGMLRLYDNTRRSLKLKAVGIPDMFAGCSFICKIADLGDLSINRTLLISECVHSISNNVHTMELTTEVIINE